MPVKEKKVCKVCPKKKKRSSEKNNRESVAEEEFLLSPEYEEKSDENTELPCAEDDSCKDLATAGYFVDEINYCGRRKRQSFFSSTAPKSRFENILPTEVTNDNQYEASIQKTVLDHLSALRVTSEPFCRRQSAIVGTIGPSCIDSSQIEDLLFAGMNIARINMAYGDRCCQLTAIQNFKTAVKNYHGKLGVNIPVGLLMDLKGAEVRTGRICHLYIKKPEFPQVMIEEGSVVRLTTEFAFIDKCTPNLIYVNFLGFMEMIRPGMKIYIDDGSIQMSVQQVKDKEAIVKTEVGGLLGNYRPVHVPMVPVPHTALSAIDEEDIELAVEENFDFIVLSKVINVDIIERLKEKMLQSLLTSQKLRETPIMVLVKISNFEAISNIDKLIGAADGVFIQRGDLGLELPPEKVFIAQKEIIAKCNLANKPVICSTQLMRSMVGRPLPNQSDVFDVAGCIEDGADGVCLTAETAIGHYPVLTVEQTHCLLREAEAAEAKKYHFREMADRLKPPIEPMVAIGMAACIIADKMKATCIIVLTTSGKSAQVISWFRPRCVVLAVTQFKKTARQLHLWRAITPLIYKGPSISNNWFDNLDLRFQFGISFGKEVGFIRAGDPLVLVSGYGKSTGFTNCVRIVYSSTEPSVFLNHDKEYYSNIYYQGNCKNMK